MPKKNADRNMVATNGKVDGKKSQVDPTVFSASIFPEKEGEVHPLLARCVKLLEKELDMPVWVLIQAERYDHPFGILDERIRDRFVKDEDTLPKDQPIGLVIDSPGGDAATAYQIATLLQKRCGGFTAIIPRYAKSAATLLALGADKIILSRHGELGPLDAQVSDLEREEQGSALSTVHALDRLHDFALQAADRTMKYMLPRSGKKIDTLLPYVLKFIADMTYPLFDQVDVLHYTNMSRALKIAQDYAYRLLLRNYGEDDANNIAQHLVEHYPEHGFIIDFDEASDFLTNIEEPTGTLDAILCQMYSLVVGQVVIGQVQQLAREEKST